MPDQQDNKSNGEPKPVPGAGDDLRTYSGILWQRVERQNEMISDIQADVRAHRERMDAQDSRLNCMFDEVRENRKEIMGALENIGTKVDSIESYQTHQAGINEAQNDAQNRTDVWKRWLWPFVINILVLMTAMGLFSFTESGQAVQEEFQREESSLHEQ